MPFASIPEAIEEIKAGRMLIVVDDEDRENEGDMLMAAEKATPEAINFMAKYGRGLICLPIIGARLDELGLNPMVSGSSDVRETAFTVSIDAKFTTTTGISAYDRAATIKCVLDQKTRSNDLSRPGHIFPLRAQEGGVLKRTGHTEAAVDLSRLAGLYPAGVICEIMDEDGNMARLPKLIEVAEKRNLKIISIADLIAYRRRTEKLVKRVTETKLPTDFGDFTIIGYESVLDTQHHIALVKGCVENKANVLVPEH